MIAALLIAATVPTAGQLTEALYDSDNMCRYISSRTEPCVEVPRRRLQAVRCIEAPATDLPRVLCRFAGFRTWREGAREEPFGPECAYLLLRVDGIWRVDRYPDAEVCEFD